MDNNGLSVRREWSVIEPLVTRTYKLKKTS